MTLRKHGVPGLLFALTVGLAIAVSPGEPVAHAQSAGPPGAWPLAAPHAPLPTMKTEGGAVLATARVVPVLYSSDPLLPDLETYFAKLGTSQYLLGALREYGVQSVSVTAPVVITNPPPQAIVDAEISNWLGGLMYDGTLPEADGNTMYQVVYPSTTAVSGGAFTGIVAPTCTPATSEAWSWTTGTPAPFGYVPRCEGNTSGLGDLDYVTLRGTAAIIGGLTSPFFFEGPAYDDPSWSGSGWAGLESDLSKYYPGFGLAQLCMATLSEAALTPPDLGYRVPRVWSNGAAALGHNPCAGPVAGGRKSPYFNAAPDMTGTAAGYLGFAKGVTVPVGGEVTIPVRLFSDGRVGGWELSAVERPDLAPDPNHVLSFSFDCDEGDNGDVRMLTIRRAAAPDGTVAPNLAFDIVSKRGGAAHDWVVLVGND